MQQENTESSLKTLHEIRNIMERSTRFMSLSGWSGVWAGVTALVGAAIAHKCILVDGYPQKQYSYNASESFVMYDYSELIFLAISVFVIALTGAYYFTWKKVKVEGGTLWTAASRSMMWSIAIPMFCGAVFCLAFIWHGHPIYFAPTCLMFYGLALYNGSKYTLTDIRYLGMLEIMLGCISLFLPGYVLYFWAAGFGVLHILYGIMMWNIYDKVAKA